MLHGRALEYYYMSCQGCNLSIDELLSRFKEYFEGAQHKRHRFFEWNNVNLRSILRDRPNQDKGKIFVEMVEDLRKLQHGLDQEHRTDAAMYNRIVSACRTTPQCSFAILQQASNLPALIDKIYAALQNSDEIEKLEKTEPSNPDAFFTDRKYHRHQPQRHASSSHKNERKRKKRCFVCQKEGCWSTHHSEKERLQATMKNRSTQAYIQEYEGNETDQRSEESENDDFESLTLKVEDLDLQDTSENYVTSISSVPHNQALEYQQELANRATYHAITKSIPTVENFVLTGRYSSDEFRGIMLDTGAAHLSTAGYGQAKAYMRQFNVAMDTSSYGKLQAKFGIGTTTSIGVLTVDSPIGLIKFHVVQAETPFLLCLQDMDKLGIFFNNLKDVIIKSDGSTVPVVRLFMHPFLIWGPTAINYLTEIELRQLHWRFGHPSVNRLVRTLERAGHDDPQHRNLLNRITKFCVFCQTHSRSPGRFKFVLKDDVYFNQSIFIDVMYIDGNPILQVVDEGT
ncbi:hypothetical protein K3495_g13972 [Podosphaera aphanis]|nr:hypothetical protein K3495_g13972 [Podosphaera aphanis]